MTVLLATLVIGLPSAVAVPKSDGYYGKTKVAPAKSENGRKRSKTAVQQILLIPAFSCN
ncbi:MAG: hypothetical protein ABGZ49_01385 [Akkermansiaceae bacterium]|nr:hypothetical protein [Roseibacillus sp.]